MASAFLIVYVISRVLTLFNGSAKEAQVAPLPASKVAAEQVPVAEPTPEPVPQAQGDMQPDKSPYRGYNSFESCMLAGTSEDQLLCKANELEREDTRLNREYKRVIAQYEKAAQEDKITTLLSLESDWIKSVNTKCVLMPLDNPGDNQRIRSQWTQSCWLDMTKKRADELSRLP